MKLKSIFPIVALFLSASASAAPLLVNGSFESNNVGDGYLYSDDIEANGWQFYYAAGVSSNNLAWAGDTGSGSGYAFLQNYGVISQEINILGNYNFNFTFDLKERTNYGDVGRQVMIVLLDGLYGGAFQPAADNNWHSFSLSISNVLSGAHTLSFMGVNPSQAADTTIFLDNIQMTATEVVRNIPEPDVLSLLSIGFVDVFTARARNRNK